MNNLSCLSLTRVKSGAKILRKGWTLDWPEISEGSFICVMCISIVIPCYLTMLQSGKRFNARSS